MAFGVDVQYSSMLHHHGPAINDQFAALIDMHAGRGVNGPDSTRFYAYGCSIENVQSSYGTGRLSCAELTSCFDEISDLSSSSVTMGWNAPHRRLVHPAEISS